MVDSINIYIRVVVLGDLLRHLRSSGSAYPYFVLSVSLAQQSGLLVPAVISNGTEYVPYDVPVAPAFQGSVCIPYPTIKLAILGLRRLVAFSAL